MTDLRDAAEVFHEALDAWHLAEPRASDAPYEAAAVIIEADRAANRADERAKVVGEIVAWLRANSGLEDCYSELRDQWLSDRIARGEWDETGVQP